MKNAFYLNHLKRSFRSPHIFGLFFDNIFLWLYFYNSRKERNIHNVVPRTSFRRIRGKLFLKNALGTRLKHSNISRTKRAQWKAFFKAKIETRSLQATLNYFTRYLCLRHSVFKILLIRKLKKTICYQVLIIFLHHFSRFCIYHHNQPEEKQFKTLHLSKYILQSN